MARATIVKSKSPGRPAGGRSTGAKAGLGRAAGVSKAAPAAASASKEELRARVEKLERANATLRVKNKELRVVAVEAAEQVDALTVQLANSERRAGRNARHEAPAEAVATREILRPARGRRKTRSTASTGDQQEDDDLGGDTRAGWDASDHADV
jgi:hypothetical protein